MPRRLLYFLFDQLYTTFAWSYDAVAWLVSGGQWYDWAAEALDYVEAGPVVEVGCGRGHLLPLLRERGWPTIGVDRSPQMARAAHRRHAGVVQGDGTRLPLADGAVGTLITTFPAPYILQRETHLEFARVVRPGGHWLWVDAPMLAPSHQTRVARLVTTVAYGNEESQAALIDRRLHTDPTDGLWRVRVERPSLRHSTIGVRIAERQ